MTRAVRCACAGVVLAAWMSSHSARAEEGMRVTAENCPFDAAELERLVRLELSSVLDSSEDASAYVVTIRCAGDEAHVELFDPLTSKTLKRRVLAPPAGTEEAERQLAITIAQLYRASWLELDAPSTEREDPLPPRVPPRTAVPEVRAARRLARPASVEAPRTAAEEATRGSVGVAFGARARHLQRPILLPSVDLAGSWWPVGELFWLSLSGGFEYASLARTTGSVDVIIGKVLGGAAIEPLVAGRWSGFAEASVGVAFTHVASSEVGPGYEGGSVGGGGVDATIGLGAAVRTGPVRLELVARGGALAGTPTGRIADDDDVDLDGPWAGGDLRVRWMF